jgi:SpoVK/Ycf46/Vps4 family AAA+-type ATPase
MGLRRRSLEERSALEARLEWAGIRSSLGNRVVGPDALLDHLATAAFVARAGHPLRILLTGPPGAGKSHIAGVLASLVGKRTITIDASSTTEPGWHGVSLQDVLAASGPPWELPGAVILIEEVDKVRVHREASGNAINKYTGQQAQYLTLLDRAGRTSVAGTSVSSGELHVILTGAFVGDGGNHPRSSGPISRENLVAYGMTPELVDRIDQVIALPPPSAHELAAILSRELCSGTPTALQGAVEMLGYSLTIQPSVYTYVAHAFCGGATAGTRAGRAVIEDAVQRALARALRDQLPIGATLHILPDDLRLPPQDAGGGPGRSRGHGRGGSPPSPRRSR